jgi:hypothetical protein
VEIPCFTLILSWVSQTTAGHTKKVTTNAIIFSAYCTGSAAGQFMWIDKYKPRYVFRCPRHPAIADTVSRNHVPWIIVGVCLLTCMVLMFAIRVLLARENKRRDAEPRDDSFDNVYVVMIDKNGNRTEVKVSKVRARFNGKHRLQFDVTVRTGVLGSDRPTKSRLQICPVISVILVMCIVRAIVCLV